MLAVTVHKWLSRPVRWVCVKERLLVLYIEEAGLIPEDFIILDRSCKLEIFKGETVGFQLSASSHGNAKSYKLTVERKFEAEMNEIISSIKSTLTRVKETPQIVPIISEPNGEKIRICSYNVNFGCCKKRSKGNKRNPIFDAILKTEASVLLLQETTIHWENYLKQQLENIYPFMLFNNYTVPEGHEDRPPAGGIAILSKYEIIQSDLIDSPVGWFPAQVSTVRTPYGEIQFLNLHLRPPLTEVGKPSPISYYSSKGDRAKEVQFYGGHIRLDLPTIVCGDFNEDTSAKSGTFWTQNMKMKSATDQFKCGITWHWLVKGYRMTARFDHIFYRGLTASNAFVLEEGASDHYPVCMDIA